MMKPPKKKRGLKCDLCRKPIGDMTVLIVNHKTCIGMKMCRGCATRFFQS